MQRGRRRSLLIALATAAVATIVLAACDPAPPPPPPPPAAAAAANDMVVRHQNTRATNGLPTVVSDGYLANYAQFHADRLSAGATSCSNLWHSSEAYSWYSGYSWGENVACVPGCPADAGAAFNLWLESPGHAANVFKPDYGLIGVGVTCNGSVQMVVAHYRSA